VIRKKPPTPNIATAAAGVASEAPVAGDPPDPVRARNDDEYRCYIYMWTERGRNAMSDDSETPDSVSATVELVGEYEEIATILGRTPGAMDELDPVSDDMEAVLEIVGRTGGATKSRIAEELPGDVTADFDADTVIHVLRVLELYELVTLDGNTWRPGPALTLE